MQVIYDKRVEIGKVPKIHRLTLFLFGCDTLYYPPVYLISLMNFNSSSVKSWKLFLIWTFRVRSCETTTFWIHTYILKMLQVSRPYYAPWCTIHMQAIFFRSSVFQEKNKIFSERQLKASLNVIAFGCWAMPRRRTGLFTSVGISFINSDSIITSWRTKNDRNCHWKIILCMKLIILVEWNSKRSSVTLKILWINFLLIFVNIVSFRISPRDCIF